MFEENQNSNVEPSFEEPKKKGGYLKVLIIIILIAMLTVTAIYSLFIGYQYLSKSKSNSVESTQVPNNQDIVGQTLDESTDSANGSKDNTKNSGSNMQTQPLRDVSGVVSAVMPSVVSITNVGTEQYQDFFGQTWQDKYESSGSGIIIGQNKSELYIVTNNHVVEGANTISVGFVDDTTVKAKVKGTDSYVDLAVLSVSIKDIDKDTLKKIKIAKFGNSDELKVGEPAIAIGNALGYGQSVTVGVISALNRQVSVDSVTNELIQTDAAINPGNSGGALINIQGKVIGINSIKFASTEVEGMGYSIPISTAQPIIDDLINKKKVDKKDAAYLGIAGVDVTDEVSQTYDMPIGVYVAKVFEGTAAEKAGLKKGDIITKVDNKEVTTMEQLSQVLKYYASGDKVDVVIMKSDNGKYVEADIHVTLGRKE
ncbi:S1C family serine protease [Anaerosacchariphilus polymeriproducens]|uniref:PDZ domain-containing protein n=1 Tax=Anaerosacchariphilus polymeriproducens TaxID=1812858 RepID=A0A371ARQ0_9FIRM|nr:trypsin-like peptidase domain-containing protein [Anaerosacchariphilus polymeriproducens]RDU22150.1 PDZ domain-containing protein [Anaerosacchariphilus polymeriproducens]